MRYDERERKAPVKKKTPKKKSADRVKADDDSDLELNSDGEVKEKPKKGGFHKEYHLSAPLADLVGEAQVSFDQSSILLPRGSKMLIWSSSRGHRW